VSEFFLIADKSTWEGGPSQLTFARDGAESLGFKFRGFVMDDDQDAPTAPVAALLYLPPRGVLPRHAHDCHRVEVIVQGSLEAEGRTLHPGDVAVSRPGVFYGPHVAGPEGSLSVEIFSTAAGVAAVMDQITE
jgi:hypothetical protein